MRSGRPPTELPTTVSPLLKAVEMEPVEESETRSEMMTASEARMTTMEAMLLTSVMRLLYDERLRLVRLSLL